MANQGIMHAAFKTGGQPLCNTKRSHMSINIEAFRNDVCKCKRCAIKLAKMDAVKAKRENN